MPAARKKCICEKKTKKINNTFITESLHGTSYVRAIT